MGSSAFASAPSWGMLPLRLVVGIVFFMHGWLKLTSFGIEGTTNFMASLGIPLPAVAAVAVTALEILGGLALIVGVLTRWVSLLFAIDMLVAILTVKLRGGFFAPDGMELELTLLAASLTLAAMGAGGFALQRQTPQPDA
jgi:putative oxidoreductase